MHKKIFEYCQLCEVNIADEADARKGYLQLIILAEDIINNHRTEISSTIIQKLEEDIKLWREYIAEELKHSEGLKKVIYSYLGVSPE